MNIEKEFIIKSCIKRCQFYGASMDGMECRHPFWDNKGAYENMIISHNDPNGIPLRCPLRTESCRITTHYKLDDSVSA